MSLSHVEVYEGDSTVEPKSTALLTTIYLTESGTLPALGDVISLLLNGTFTHVRVLARTHLVSDADSPGHVRWLKAWLFVTRM